MARIRKFLADNYRKFSFSIIVNLALCLFFNILFYCRYHTVDDVFMEMNVCGAYGKFDPHLIYSNIILGYVLKFLYHFNNSFPWYGLMHILMALFSLSTIMYVFMNNENRIAKILVMVAIFIVSYEAYTKVQFTKTAAYLACAGYILIASSLEDEKRIIKQIFGIIFIWNSFMIRTGMFLGSSAICLGCLMPKIISYLKGIKQEHNRKDFVNLICVGLCSLLIVGASFFIDSSAYKTEGWSYYKRFNEYTTQFQDINFPSYTEYEEEFNKLGIYLEDYRLYDDSDHNDPDLFDLEKMEVIKKLQPYKTVNSNEIVMFGLRGYNTLFKQKSLATFTLVAVFIVLFFVFGCRNSWISWLSVLYTGFATVFAFAYTYFMHGWFDRTTLAVMTAFIFTMLYLLEPKENKISKTIVYCFAVFTVVCSLFIWSEYFRWNMNDWREEYQINHEALNEIYEDKDHLYISRTSLPLWKRYYTPYDKIRFGSMSNYSPLGDWIANTPLLKKTLTDYGVRNPYKDMVNNDKVYFIGFSDNMQPVIDYIQRHYYQNLEVETVKECGPYVVYSLKGSN